MDAEEVRSILVISQSKWFRNSNIWGMWSTAMRDIDADVTHRIKTAGQSGSRSLSFFAINRFP